MFEVEEKEIPVVGAIRWVARLKFQITSSKFNGNQC